MLHMATLNNIFQKALQYVTGKSYTGILQGGLPASTKWGASDYLKAHDISLYTNKALTKRSEKVGEVQFVLKNKKTGEVIQDHPLLDLLRYPSKTLTSSQLYGLYQNHMDIMGSAYFLLDATPVFGGAPKVTGMDLLRPDMVKVKQDATGAVVGYEYKGPNGTTVTYEPWQVIRVWRPDPANPLQGTSLLKAGVTAIQTEVQIGAYHARIIENGGKVDGVFKFKTPRLTKAQLQELKDGYDAEYADARKSGKPLFLGGDAEYIRMGMTPDEVAFLETKRVTLEDICIMTSVPKELLGTMDGTKYDNADAAIRIFLSETIKPQLKALTAALDNALIPDEFTLSFIDPTPENKEAIMKALETGKNQGLISTNEGRRILGRVLGEDLEDVDGGDDILINFNLIPLGSSSVVEKAAADTTKKKAVSSKGAAADTNIEHPLRDVEARKIYHSMQVKRLDRRSAKFKPAVVRYLNGQRDRLVDMLQPTKTHVYRKEGLLDEVLNIELEVKIGKEAFLPVLQDILAASGKDAMELVGSSGTFSMSAEVVSWLDDKTEVFTRQFNETTYNQLKREFEASLAAQEGRAELIDRIKGVYQGITTGRANVIARTETHGVIQYGTMQGYSQAAMPIKIWVSVLDTETRGQDPTDEADHVSIDGEERPLNMPFSNGLMYPGQKGAPAAEVVNCRCSI